MKKIVLGLFMAMIFFAVSSCKKNKDDNEVGLAVTTTPANNSNNLNILGPDFPLKVEITSTMPAQGVKIEISAAKEGSADPAFFTNTNTTSAPQNNYTITGTPSGATCVVSIKVTSITKSTNVWSGSYRYSKK